MGTRDSQIRDRKWNNVYKGPRRNRCLMGGRASVWADKNVLGRMVVIATQQCECSSCHRTVHLKTVKMVNKLGGTPSLPQEKGGGAGRKTKRKGIQSQGSLQYKESFQNTICFQGISEGNCAESNTRQAVQTGCSKFCSFLCIIFTARSQNCERVCLLSCGWSTDSRIPV